MANDLIEGLYRLFRTAVPRLDYFALYEARVVKWSRATQTVDVQPGDARLPSMSGLRVRGPAGEELDINVDPGPSILVGWENGDPARPYASLFGGGVQVIRRVLNADEIFLAGEDGAEPVPLGNLLHTLLAAIKTHTHPGGSGSPVIASLELAVPALRWDVRSSHVKAK